MSEEYYGIKDFPRVARTAKIELTYCEWFDEKSDIWCFDLHNHPSVIEFMFFRSGKGKIDIFKETHAISYYDLIIYPAGMYHKEALLPTENQDVICIRIRIGDGLNFNAPIHVKDQDQTLNWLFKKIFYECKSADSLVNLSVDYVRLVLLYCYNYHTKTNGYMDTVIAYINDHFCDNISVSRLAEMVYVSEAHLIRNFKKLTGTTLVNYILMLRVDTAKHMLTTSSYSIEMISDTLGFTSPKYFSRVFKKYTNMAPSDYRKEHR